MRVTHLYALSSGREHLRRFRCYALSRGTVVCENHRSSAVPMR